MQYGELLLAVDLTLELVLKIMIISLECATHWLNSTIKELCNIDQNHVGDKVFNMDG